jgi:hypothetical protein
MSSATIGIGLGLVAVIAALSRPLRWPATRRPAEPALPGPRAGRASPKLPDCDRGEERTGE